MISGYHMYGRVRLGGHSLVILCTCVIVVCFFTTYYRAFPFSAPFFLVHLFPFLSPYIESICSFISFVFQMFSLALCGLSLTMSELLPYAA